MPKPNIERNDILRVYPAAARSRPLLEAAVLDVAPGCACLSNIHNQGLFEACRMVFKGGTALRKFHFGHKSRLSFDLDFDAEEGAEALFAEAMRGYSSQGFEFEVAERRGHHSLLVASPLFPGGTYEVKVDFSSRGCWLPAENLRPLHSPALPEGVWDPRASIPTMKLEENIAEKMSRWQTRRLVRDLFDIAAASTKISDMPLMAEMYVLKAHKNWSSQLPSRRPPQAMIPLTEATAAAKTARLPLDDLVHPTAVSDSDKSARIQDDLAIMESLAKSIGPAHARHTPRGNRIRQWQAHLESRPTNRSPEESPQSQPARPRLARHSGLHTGSRLARTRNLR